MSNKKPNTTQITETWATLELYYFLKLKKIKEFEIQTIQNELFEKWAQELKEVNNLKVNKNYYQFIYGHARKQLKKEGWIEKIDKVFHVYIQDSKPFLEKNLNRFGWETNITIKKVYEFCDNSNYMLPSYQRGTAWKSPNDYRELALSIFNYIPLGVMYFHKMNREQALLNSYYKIKSNVISKKEIDFQKIAINKIPDGKLFSIIDGQQRITAINVIIGGTLNGKKMFFNEQKEGIKKFEFKSINSHEIHWTPMDQIFNELNKLNKKNYKVDRKKEFKKIHRKFNISEYSIKRLFNGFFKQNLISICEMDGEDQDEILEVFIRINSFGKKLRPADIMLSMLSGKQKDRKDNIRDKAADLHKKIKEYKPNFTFGALLKLIRVFFTDSPKMNHSDFFEKNDLLDNYFNIEKNGWNNLTNSTIHVLDCIKEIGIDLNNIPSDNAITPIIYWHAHHKLKKIVSDNIKNNIGIYLTFVSIFKHFKSGTDSKLSNLMKDVKNDPEFSNWKIGSKEQATKENIKQIIDEWIYGKDDLNIKFILGINKHKFDGSNSIEHLIPKSKGGSNKIWNLALLPNSINSELSNKNIDIKINKLKDKYKKNEEEIYKALILENKTPTKNRINNIVELIINSKMWT